MSLQDDILKKLSISKKKFDSVKITKRDFSTVEKNLVSKKLYKELDKKYQVSTIESEYLKMKLKQFY